MEPPNANKAPEINQGPSFKRVVRGAGFEPTTYGFGDRHSIQLSYPRKLLVGWMMGIEPTNDGTTTRCLNHLATPTTLRYTRDLWRARLDLNQ